MRSPTLSRRLTRIALWVGGVALATLVADLLGIPVGEWIEALFDKLAEVPAWAIVVGVILQSAQTALAALAWYGILRAAPVGPGVSYRIVLASYATAVALNGFLPANLGTWVMLLMFATLFAGATFTMMLSGIVVQKIPFAAFNLALYLYLFVSVAGSFSVKLGFLDDHTGLVVGILAGGAVLLALLGRAFWAKLEGLRAQVAKGGAVLGEPRRFLLGVVAPSLGSYLARLATVAVFLGAYGIPVTFHDVATVTASNSISNSVSATPGGVGVTQAMNSVALASSTDAATATAYSISQQAGDLGLEPGLRRRPRLLGVRLERRQGPGRVLLCRRQGEEPRDARAAPAPGPGRGDAGDRRYAASSSAGLSFRRLSAP